MDKITKEHIYELKEIIHKISRRKPLTEKDMKQITIINGAFEGVSE